MGKGGLREGDKRMVNHTVYVNKICAYARSRGQLISALLYYRTLFLAAKDAYVRHVCDIKGGERGEWLRNNRVSTFLCATKMCIIIGLSVRGIYRHRCNIRARQSTGIRRLTSQL